MRTADACGPMDDFIAAIQADAYASAIEDAAKAVEADAHTVSSIQRIRALTPRSATP